MSAMELHPLLAARRSPRAFDPHAPVTDAEVELLLEAARWAPSSFNRQPWRFLLARRDSDRHQQVFPHLTEHNRRWAGQAPLLLVAGRLTHTSDGRPLRHAAYDLGQAVAHLTVQATALGLYVHQMAGFHAAELHAELGLPDDVVLEVVSAVGRLGDPADLPEDLHAREIGPRHRHPVASLLL